MQTAPNPLLNSRRGRTIVTCIGAQFFLAFVSMLVMFKSMGTPMHGQFIAWVSLVYAAVTLVVLTCFVWYTHPYQPQQTQGQAMPKGIEIEDWLLTVSLIVTGFAVLFFSLFAFYVFGKVDLPNPGHTLDWMYVTFVWVEPLLAVITVIAISYW